MNSLIAQSSKALIKQKSKEATGDAIEIQELMILQLQQSVNSLKSKVDSYEAQYSTVAKVKLEKRLKSGVDGKRAEEYQKQVDYSTVKKETLEDTWDMKIQQIENDKMTTITSYERKIEEYQDRIKAAQLLYDSKLSTANAKKKEAIIKVQATIDTFTGYVNKYYEDAQPEITITYPPAYYKCKDELERQELALKDSQYQLLLIKAQGFVPSKSIVDIAKDKHRLKIIAEEKEVLRQAELRQREEEARINLQKKAEYKAEEERAKLQTKVAVPIVKEDPAKTAIKLREMKASEEYRKAQGIDDLDSEEILISDAPQPDETDAELLDDYIWATKRNLPIPDGILQKLKDRGLL